MAGCWRNGLVAVVLCVALPFTGCSSDWVGQAEEIVGALIPAATNSVVLVAALEGKSVSAQDVQMVQNAGSQAVADLELVKALIAEYRKADGAARLGILSKIQGGISSVQVNLQGVLLALHIKDAATQAKVTAVIGIVLAEVQALGVVVQSASSGQGSSARARGMGRPRVPLAAGEFVASYNAAMRAKTGCAEVDRVAGGLGIRAGR